MTYSPNQDGNIPFNIIETIDEARVFLFVAARAEVAETKRSSVEANLAVFLGASALLIVIILTGQTAITSIYQPCWSGRS